MTDQGCTSLSPQPTGLPQLGAYETHTMSLFPESDANPDWHITVEQILEELPDGVVLLNEENVICWANKRFRAMVPRDLVIGEKFYSVFDNPEVLGPDFCPFHTAFVTSRLSTTTLKIGEKQHFQIQVTRVDSSKERSSHLIVVVRDISEEIDRQQQLEAIHRAGIEMANLPPENVSSMTKDERVDMLKEDILHFTQDILHFNVIEVRLLDETTNELKPLISIGIDDAAACRSLSASITDNGITGFVAATGQSYLCEDTREDPLYLEGFPGALSSLTVPLKMHEQVIGTFNVESPKVREFNDNDLLFLEVFAREVAVALNTLELLAVQDFNVTMRNLEIIHGAVALPIDHILNEAAFLYEHYSGDDTDQRQRLRSILSNARDIRETIQKVGYTLSPMDAIFPVEQIEHQRILINRHILVVDSDKKICSDAHRILERYGCIVDSAANGEVANAMVRSYAGDLRYDVILSDILLPDMYANVLLTHLQRLMDDVPLALMRDFGYDANHTQQKCRELGHNPNAILSKPFRVDQMLDVIEMVIQSRG